MKKSKLLLPLSILGLFALVGCGNSTSSSESSTTDSGSSSTSTTSVATSDAEDIEETSVADDSITSDFTLVNSSGTAVTPSGGVYTLSAADTYTASGKLSEGQILVNAADAEVVLELDGVSITNSSESPIYSTTCDTLKVKAKADTNNYIYDKRTTDYSTTTGTDGMAAIYCYDGDLDLVGKGNLYVYSYQNSGVQSKDNVKVKNQTLVIRAQNNGIKGNDKVTIEENPTIDIYADNNGIITSNSDVGSSAQHGYVYLNGGTTIINSNGDGIDAAYAIVTGTSTDDDGVAYAPSVAIYTDVYSAFYNSSVSSLSAVKYAYGGQSGNMGPGGQTSGTSSADKSEESSKGLKAGSYIEMSVGSIYSKNHDDGLHANKDSLESGSTGTGAITVSGGEVKIYSSDDGLHAEGALKVSGGTVNVLTSHEGVEGNTIAISGGTVIVTPVNTTDSEGVSIATDDAINASSSLTISGGYVDASVNSGGDYDCLDSNGSFTMTGGVVVARGPNNGTAGAIDVDGAVKMSGGTLLVCGSIAGSSTSLATSRSVTSTASSGSHSITVDGTTYSFTNSYTYSSCACYSSTSSVSTK
ncbi:MAG: carbohydrate-binding domain-containing protein [Bacilli bacterium]|nr:carbohydrate-binding domain-containing protein [Bacilli bacterium]